MLPDGRAVQLSLFKCINLTHVSSDLMMQSRASDGSHTRLFFVCLLWLWGVVSIKKTRWWWLYSLCFILAPGPLETRYVSSAHRAQTSCHPGVPVFRYMKISRSIVVFVIACALFFLTPTYISITTRVMMPYIHVRPKFDHVFQLLNEVGIYCHISPW